MKDDPIFDRSTADVFNSAANAGNTRGNKHAVDQQTVFLHAALTGDAETVTRFVVETPACLTWRVANNDNKTGLMLAAENGHSEVVAAIAAHTDGVYLDMGSAKGSSALTMAAFNGHTQVVELLIDAGANVNHTNNKGVTPLMAASWSGDLQSVEILIENNVTLDAADAEGTTALLYAVQNGHLRIVRKLVSEGAALSHSNKEGMDITAAAEASGSAEMMVLIERIKKQQSTIQAANELREKKKEKREARRAERQATRSEVTTTKEDKKPKRSKAAPPAEKPILEMVDEVRKSAAEAVKNIQTPKPVPEEKKGSPELRDLNDRLKKAGFF